MLSVILLINMDKFLFVREGRYTTCSWNRGYDQPTDWLTILPSILLSKYNASLTGPPATLFTRCHVSQTWLLSTASLAGTHSRNELFHPSRRVGEREREKRERGEREGENREKKYRCMTCTLVSKENIVADTAKPPPLRSPWPPPYRRGWSEGWNVGVITAAETTNRIADADWIMYRANCHSEMDSRLHCRCSECT